jgi:hypothetical protein
VHSPLPLYSHPDPGGRALAQVNMRWCQAAGLQMLYRPLRSPAPDPVLAWRRGVGLTPIERWRQILGRARKSGEFAGVDADLFPRDIGVLGRYHRAVRTISARYPMPAPLSLVDLAQFVQEHGHEYPVAFERLQDAVREPPRAAFAHL